MPTLHIEHAISDIVTWRAAFDRFADARARAGVLDARVQCPVDDPHHVVTVKPPRAFCANEKIANDVNYRWDGVHYYIPGASLFMSAVGPQLLAIAHHVPQ